MLGFITWPAVKMGRVGGNWRGKIERGGGEGKLFHLVYSKIHDAGFWKDGEERWVGKSELVDINDAWNLNLNWTM